MKMGELIKIIESYSKKTFVDEDGGYLTIDLNESADIKDILKFESDNQIKLPENLKNFLLFSNGMNLFGIKIHSLREMEYFPFSGILSIHSWGNGDFDCLSLKDAFPKGSIVFMSHNEEKIALVCNSLADWLTGVVAEVELIGALLHPLDFNDRESNGMYKNIFNKL